LCHLRNAIDGKLSSGETGIFASKSKFQSPR
jgi:hypothetical protein